MRILFICDFFPPFIKGGAEISSYWQAKELSQRNIEVIVLAPQYRDRIKINRDNFKKYWYYFPFKTTSISPIMFLNPIFIIYQFLNIFKVTRKEKIDIIHCQGKFSMPAVVLANIILNKPLVLTLRDYQGVCNHAFCLYKEKKSCNFISFYRKDFINYFRHYIKNKNIFSFFFQLIISYLGRINVFLLSFFLKKADRIICVSNYLKQVYIKNGYDDRKMQTIYNPPPRIKGKITTIPSFLQDKINQFSLRILYAGRLSLGKGAGLLIAAGKEIIKKNKNILIIFSGKIHYPIRKVNSSQMVFLGRITNKLLLNIMQQIDLVCIPSIWPEPLSRGVIEAFYMGKPVLCSKRGGTYELVKDKINGWLFNPSKNDLLAVLNNIINQQKQIKLMGNNGRQFINQLKEGEIKKLIILYQTLL